MKQPLVIPVALGLLDGRGHELSTRLAGEAAVCDTTRVVLAEQAETRFVFEDVPSLPTPSLLRGFSAPVKMSGVSPERLRLLAAHDLDPFVRWESGQQYAAVRLREMAAAWRSGTTLPPVDPGLMEAASSTLAAALRRSPEVRPGLRRDARPLFGCHPVRPTPRPHVRRAGPAHLKEKVKRGR